MANFGNKITSMFIILILYSLNKRYYNHNYAKCDIQYINSLKRLFILSACKIQYLQNHRKFSKF